MSGKYRNAKTQHPKSTKAVFVLVRSLCGDKLEPKSGVYYLNSGFSIEGGLNTQDVEYWLDPMEVGFENS